MAIVRDAPYQRFNFQVALGGDSGDGGQGTVVGGFFEVILPSTAIDVTDVRSGNERVNVPRKVTGLTRTSDVTLKRGVVGSLDLWHWFKNERDGMPDVRQVTVTLLNENHEPVMTWRLRNCRPIKYTAPSLNANASGPAIEELVLSVEGIEIE